MQNVHLERTVVLEQMPHVLDADLLIRSSEVLEVLGDVDILHTHKGKKQEHERNGNVDQRACREHLRGVLAAEHGKKNHVRHDHEQHGNQIGIDGTPHADDGTLTRVGSDDGRHHVSRDIAHRVAHDVDEVKRDEQNHAAAISPHEEQQRRDRADNPANRREEANLAPLRGEAVDHQCNGGIDDTVEDTRTGEQHAGETHRNTVVHVRRIAHKRDERIERHRHALRHLSERNLPTLRTAILDAVRLACRHFLRVCHRNPSLLARMG